MIGPIVPISESVLTPIQHTLNVIGPLAPLSESVWAHRRLNAIFIATSIFSQFWLVKHHPFLTPTNFKCPIHWILQNLMSAKIRICSTSLEKFLFKKKHTRTRTHTRTHTCHCHHHHGFLFLLSFVCYFLKCNSSVDVSTNGCAMYCICCGVWIVNAPSESAFVAKSTILLLWPPHHWPCDFFRRRSNCVLFVCFLTLYAMYIPMYTICCIACNCNVYCYWFWSNRMNSFDNCPHRSACYTILFFIRLYLDPFSTTSSGYLSMVSVGTMLFLLWQWILMSPFISLVLINTMVFSFVVSCPLLLLFRLVFWIGWVTVKTGSAIRFLQ